MAPPNVTGWPAIALCTMWPPALLSALPASALGSPECQIPAVAATTGVFHLSQQEQPLSQCHPVMASRTVHHTSNFVTCLVTTNLGY